MLHQEEEEKGLLIISRVFHPVFWWLEQGSLPQPWGCFGCTHPSVLHTRTLLGGSSPRDRLPPQKPQAWEVGGGVGKPKIQPSSNSHPPL